MKKSVVICIVSLAVSLLFVIASYAGDVQWTYNQLATKDLNQMSKIVNDALAKAKKETPPNTEILRDVTRTIFMRSNKDRMIDKVFGEVRSLLEANDEFDSTFDSLISEAIDNLQKADLKPALQVSYLVFLENYISEFKPDIEDANVKKEMRRIYDAKIKISSKAASERKLRLMEGSTSPSEIAGKVLKIKD